ncbi:hypothetical protein KGP26_07410 [Serratia sp. JSRIV002]|uniref:hypothetical protein n=1 Tax=Serratia sp. JSRIV002 TaxID=2831894 RepID=UPI001CBC2CCA|nr:hypothetical protein [Serratia sp. JSRIV002]UAN52883.1 hypothetical protein KGP26_07410 [Serratia sp. JSRIV002]
MTATPLLPDSAIVDDVIGTLARYGWNVDRRSLSPVLTLIMNRQKAHEDVARLCCRYLEEPERLLIDMAIENQREKKSDE